LGFFILINYFKNFLYPINPKNPIKANEKSINAYRPNIGLQIWDSIKTGWFMLENIVSFIVVLWPFALIGFLGFMGYKKFLK
jgi:hypothetical protein